MAEKEGDKQVVIVDVDGTLVDAVYQHALCWHRAFSEVDVKVPVWRCHRAVGMGGDQLVPGIAGEEVESEHGEQLRRREAEMFDELIDEVQLLDGAAELIKAIKERGHEVVLASSAKESDVRRHINALGVGELIAGYTCADDVDASKPEPNLLEAALAKAEGTDAVMVGDTIWDIEAADRAGIECIALLTGGFGEGELREAGAADVFQDPATLTERLDDCALA